MKRTGRGFLIFADGIEAREGTVDVQESSLAFEGAHVWLFHRGVTCREHLGEHQRPAIQLSVESAQSLVYALLEFIRAAQADELMEPAVREGKP